MNPTIAPAATTTNPISDTAGAVEEGVDEVRARRGQAPDRERRGEDDPDDRLGRGPGPPLQRPDQDGADEQGRHRAEDRLAVQGEGEADARQRDGGERVGGERHAAHYGEAAHQAGRHRHGDREHDGLSGHGRGTALDRT
jgi:hypothetical protein